MKTPLTMIALALVCGLAGAACSSGSDYVYIEPAATEQVDEGRWRVVLTELASQRAGVETTTVANQTIDGVARLTVPYSSVIYHFEGSTWAYTNPEPLTFVREPIEIDYIDGAMAVLSAGPGAGTSVVSVGAAELYGVEFGIGK